MNKEVVYYESDMGWILLEAEESFLTSVRFVKEGGNTKTTYPALQYGCDYLDSYFAKQKPIVDLNYLKIQGTPFQKRVWLSLLEIPYGTTISYQELGNRIIKQTKQLHMSSQAIGQALTKNPIVLFLPCHRVIGKDGSLTGYAYGIERKKKLLHLEGVIGY